MARTIKKPSFIDGLSLHLEYISIAVLNRDYKLIMNFEDIIMDNENELGETNEEFHGSANGTVRDELDQKH
jgi:hypothetical protein